VGERHNNALNRDNSVLNLTYCHPKLKEHWDNIIQHHGFEMKFKLTPMSHQIVVHRYNVFKYNIYTYIPYLPHVDVDFIK